MFETKGFLGDEINSIAVDNYNKHQKIFLLLEDINQYAITFRSRINLLSNDVRGILLVSLFARIINAIQGSTIMYKLGMNLEAKAITRYALETLFFLKAVFEDEDFYKNDLASTECYNRFQTIKRIRNNPNTFGQLIELMPDLDDDYRKYSNNKPSKLQIRNVAKKAKMDEIYDLAYCALCNEVHINIRSVEANLIADNDHKTIEAIDCMPSTKDIERIFSTNCFIIFEATDCLKEYFKLTKQDEQQALFNRYNEIF